MSVSDVPSPIDLRDPVDAATWEQRAQSRPGRSDIFAGFLQELRALPQAHRNVLELGSGPGFLAEFLLSALQDMRLTLLDFSPAMHELARARLADFRSATRFVVRSFKETNWAIDVSTFDAVITNQSVHELRHKRHAVVLHSQVRGILKPGAPYLVADHYLGEGGMSNDQLYMTIEQQSEALASAGFASVDRVATSGSLVLHRAA